MSKQIQQHSNRILYHDKIEYILRAQGYFNIDNSISLIYKHAILMIYINRA